MARLSHPNVVPIYDVGSVDGGIFIAMELVAGKTLAQWSRELGVREILAVFRDAGREYRRSSCGRDHPPRLKPDNVQIGEDGRVRVMDFGLARPSHDQVRSPLWRPERISALKTTTGMIAGTPAYMSPEQLDGGCATPASDRFSSTSRCTRPCAASGRSPEARSRSFAARSNVQESDTRARAGTWRDGSERCCSGGSRPTPRDAWAAWTGCWSR